MALESLLDAHSLPASYDPPTRTLSLDGVFGNADTLYWAATDTGFGDFLTVSFGAAADVPAPPTGLLLSMALLGSVAARCARGKILARAREPRAPTP